MSEASRSHLLLGGYLLALLAVVLYLAQLLPFSAFYVPVDFVVLAKISLVFVGFFLLDLGIIAVTAVTTTEYRSARLALILLVSLAATLASSSQTIASGSLDFCNTGVVSKGFPFPWIFHRQLLFLGNGVTLPRCYAPATRFELPVLAPLFFTFNILFYFAACLAISQLYAALVKPITARWKLNFG